MRGMDEIVDELLSYEGYTLVFEENFEAEHLDRDSWNVELHDPGWVNRELQEYVDSEEVLYLQNGLLHIRPVRLALPDGRVSYRSGRISTQGKHEFTYGLFEARLKVPRGKGFLPAFWLMTADEERWGQWPVCGEIDIMEILGQDTRTNYGTLHYGLPHEENQGAFTLPEGDFAEEFHTFSLEWLPGSIRWYVDGRRFHEAARWFTAGEESRPFPAPFDHDKYLILNLAVGGVWPGPPDETADFDRAAFVADYVRVYQKTQGTMEEPTWKQSDF